MSRAGRDCCSSTANGFTAGWVSIRNATQFEVSGYHHNVAGDFLSLRPAIYAAGSGEVRVRNVRYTALPAG
jgi:xylan 1,4-beta-xylosidase